MRDPQWLFVWRRPDDECTEENLFYPMPNWVCFAPDWKTAQEQFWKAKPDIKEGDPIFIAMIDVNGTMRRNVLRVETVPPRPITGLQFNSPEESTFH